MTALMRVAYNGHIDVVAELMNDSRLDINLRNKVTKHAHTVKVGTYCSHNDRYGKRTTRGLEMY